MNESAPYEEPVPPQNISIVEVPGEMVPSRGKSGFNRYKNTVDGKYYFQLFDDPKGQFIVSELLGTVVPRAPIVKAETEPGSPAYFSLDATEHPDFIEDEEYSEDTFLNTWLVYAIFSDSDHNENHNMQGKIFFDFGQADLTGKKYHHDEASQRVKTTADFFNKQSERESLAFKGKVESFKQAISGEEGLGFITALLQKANYKETTAEAMQIDLLNRCNAVLDSIPLE